MKASLAASVPAAGMVVACTALFAAASLASGFAALTYQVLWQRALTQTIGSDSISVVLIVTIFMVWLGAGAEAARLLVKRTRAQIALIYAAVEVAIGAYGIASIDAIRRGNYWFSLLELDSIWVDFIFNLLLLAPAVFAMGMTTTLIVHVVRRNLANLGRTVGLIYGLNIAGAAAGALLSGLILIEVLGLIQACWFAALLNIIAALAAVLAARYCNETQPHESVWHPNRFGMPGFSAVLFGFGTLALQVIFFRILSNYLTLSPVVFPIVLCAYLLLMASGQMLGGWLADVYNRRLEVIAAAFFLAGAALVAGALRFPPELAAEIGALRFTTFSGSLVAEHSHLIGDPPVVTAFVFSLGFMLAVVAWSALFPVLMRVVSSRIDQVAADFGRVYMLYTIGNVVGAFVTGMVLLPIAGTEAAAVVTILAVAVGVLCLSIRVLKSADRKSDRPVVFGIALAGAAFSLVVPANYYGSFRLGSYQVADVFEGREGVATVVPTQQFYWIVDMSRTASASALVRDPGPEDQYQAWRWNHTELMALDEGFRPRRVLVIGLGHAYLVDALLDLPFVEEVVIVELSEEILHAVRAYTRTSTRRVFTDSRVKIVIADGRRYVQSALRRGERFDLIQVKINEPWHAGSGNLFTVEFFALLKEALAPNGYLGVRPLIGHLSDGLRVFRDAVYPGYYHLFFKNGLMPRVDRARVTNDIREAWQRALPGDRNTAQSRSNVLEVMYFDSVPAALQTDVNSDDSPTFEYTWVRQTMGRWRSPRESLSDGKFDNYRHSVVVGDAHSGGSALTR